MTSLIISILAILISILTFVFSWARDRKINTINAYHNLQEHLYFLYQYDKDEIETFVTDFNSEEFKAISSCVARVEIFATGVKERIYDFNVLYAIAHGYLDRALRDKIEYVIDVKNKNRNETFYKNTLWLLDKMDMKTSKNAESR